METVNLHLVNDNEETVDIKSVEAAKVNGTFKSGMISDALLVKSGTKDGNSTASLIGTLEDGTVVVLHTTGKLFHMINSGLLGLESR